MAQPRLADLSELAELLSLPADAVRPRRSEEDVLRIEAKFALRAKCTDGTLNLLRKRNSALPSLGRILFRFSVYRNI